MCTHQLNISHIPQIYTRSATRGDVICVNSTSSYFTLILNRWDHCLIFTHRWSHPTEEPITDGPYTATSAYSGFDFGDQLSAGLDITVEQNTEISFGALNFYSKSHVRVISNHPDDRFGLSSTASDSLVVAHNQNIQYFNAAMK
jgi:hypothetical protein